LTGRPDEDLDRPALEALQARRLAALIDGLLPANRFYARKFADAGLTPVEIRAPADLARLPFTTKDELAADQAAHPPYGTALSRPLTAYSRLHQTSGTSTGRPLRWLDTPEGWDALLGCWAKIYRMVGLVPGERVFFPFSFGPFLGFWTAFEAAQRAGFLVLPGGGMTTTARLRFLLDHAATAVCCTPTYALHLAETAQREGLDLAASAVRTLIVAGEPGGGIPATRDRIEAAWGARLFDHYGLTEIGPVAVECADARGGLTLLETDYVAEVVDPATGEPVPAGTAGELVLTTLGRTGSPLLRYRTGDVVRAAASPGRRALLWLEGGVRGRADDMIHVRGNNLYPSALEAVVRRVAGVAEYRVTLRQDGPLTAVRIEVEPDAALNPATATGLAARIDRAVRDELLFRAEVETVAPGTLPRFEMKAKRVVKQD
jgi:phenylacetate-CoA ligase